MVGMGGVVGTAGVVVVEGEGTGMTGTEVEGVRAAEVGAGDMGMIEMVRMVAAAAEVVLEAGWASEGAIGTDSTKGRHGLGGRTSWSDGGCHHHDFRPEKLSQE